MSDDMQFNEPSWPAEAAAGAARALAGKGLLSGPDPLRPPPSIHRLDMSVDLSSAPAEVLDFCLRSENFSAIMPGRMQVLWLTSKAGELGGTYAFRWWLKGVVPVRWVAHIDSLDPGRSFSDIQVRGLFRYFHHTHLCELMPAGGTRYTDTIRYASLLGPRIDRSLVKAELRRTFRERHRRMARMLGTAA